MLHLIQPSLPFVESVFALLGVCAGVAGGVGTMLPWMEAVLPYIDAVLPCMEAMLPCMEAVLTRRWRAADLKKAQSQGNSTKADVRPSPSPFVDPYLAVSVGGRSVVGRRWATAGFGYVCSGRASTIPHFPE